MEPGITFVLTSCGRPHLLKPTLDSFFKYNDHPISRYIVVEDMVERSHEVVSLLAGYPQIELIKTPGHVGQMSAIDMAYSSIDTEYIFHCEDDWEFMKSGFMKRSMNVLSANPDVLQVHLRKRTDLNGHPVHQIPPISGEDLYRLEHGFRDVWNGFSFNPGLKRLVDYKRIGGSYKAIGHEAENSMRYRELGYFAVVFANDTFVRHIGYGHHIPF